MGTLLMPSFPKLLRLCEQTVEGPILRASFVAGFGFCEYKHYLEKVLGPEPPVIALIEAQQEGIEAHEGIDREFHRQERPARRLVDKASRAIRKDLREKLEPEALRAQTVASEMKDFRELVPKHVPVLPTISFSRWFELRANEEAFYLAHLNDPTATQGFRGSHERGDELPFYSSDLGMVGHPDEVIFTPSSIYIKEDKPLNEDFRVYKNYKLQLAYYGLMFRDMTKSFNDSRPIKLIVRVRGGSLVLWLGSLDDIASEALTYLERVKYLLQSKNPRDFDASCSLLKRRYCGWFGTQEKSAGCNMRCIA